MQGRVVPLFFTVAVLGPFLAGPVFLLIMAAVSAVTGDDPGRVLKMFEIFPDVLKYSYIIGLVPALLTGLLLALFWRRKPGRRPLLLAAPLVGAVLTFFSALIQSQVMGNGRLDPGSLFVFGMFALVGAITALILATLVCFWPADPDASL